MQLTINHLPTDIYPLIRELLPTDDFFCLLNTSKSIFQQIKRDHAYYKLTEKASLRIVKDGEFRGKVLRLVKDPSRQMALHVFESGDELAVFGPNLTVHKIIYNTNKSPSYRIPYLPHVSKFESMKPASDISNGSHFLSLTIRLAEFVTDISNLANVQYLKIYAGKGLSEDTFNCLGGQKELLLCSCPGLLTCHHFSSIQSLTICDCPNLHDISPLHGIRDLSIIKCPQIRDISCLGDHHKLKLSECAYKLHGYEILCNIPIVTLGYCDISDLIVLENAKEVTLWGCNEVKDVTPLRNVRKLHLSSCSQITDISSLDGVKELHIGSLPNLTTSFQSMKPYCVLSKIGFHEPTFLRHYRAVQKLVIWQFETPQPLPPLRSLKRVEFLYINNDFSFNGFGEIHTVIVLDCRLVSSLAGLGNNRCVEITYCPLITDVSCLKNVPMVKISYCSGITDYSCLRDVPRLQIKV